MSGRPRWSVAVLAWTWSVAVLALLPSVADAQTLSGATEWTVAGGSTTSGGQTSASHSFWQNYSINFGSFIVDPRLVKYDAGLTFGTSTRSFGGEQGARHGGQRGLGYRLSASLFPARPFPLSVQLSRNNVAQSGELQTASPIRGGIAVPPGQPQPNFETRSNSLAVNWQLGIAGLPHLNVGYRSDDTETSGGGYAAQQRDGEFHAIVAKDTTNTHHAFRFQRTSSEHFFAQAFNQRFSELDYDFGLQFARRSRLSARAGRRSSYSLFEAPLPMIDSGTGVAQPAEPGNSDTTYAMSGVTFEPGPRVSVGLTGSVDSQKTASVTTTSRLMTTTARVEPFQGLSVSASGNYGTLGQVVGEVPVTVLTRTAQVGASYRASVRRLQGSVSGNRRVGENSALDGRVGRVESWSGDTSLSAVVLGGSVSVGYDRRHSEDAILDFGNFDVRRGRVSLQFTGQRFAVMGNWDRTLSDRGRALTLVQGKQHSYSASLFFQWRGILISGNGGGFDSRSTFGSDHTYFAGVTGETRVRRVRFSGALRQEKTSTSVTQLDQRSLVWFAKAEYTRRLFGVALEYRLNSQRLQFDQAPVPAEFRGRQFNLRLLRKFGRRM